MRATQITNKTVSTIAAGSISAGIITILSWALPQVKVNIPGEVITAFVMLATTGLAAYQTKESASNFDLDDLRDYVYSLEPRPTDLELQEEDSIERG